MSPASSDEFKSQRREGIRVQQPELFFLPPERKRGMIGLRVFEKQDSKKINEEILFRVGE